MTRQRWLTLAVVSAGTAMLLLDVTIVNVALPSIRDDLGAGFDELQWVIDAYALALAATLLSAGVLADRLGRRLVFVVGLAIFTVCSALCGLAGSPLALDLARAAQGVGAAAMFAASLALLAREFRGAERGLAVGMWGAVTGLALAVGPLVGGLIIDAVDWRWIFLVNLPLGVTLIWLTMRVVPASPGERAERLDVLGMTTFGATAVLATFALIRGNADGWSSLPITGAFALAVVMLACFIAVERTTASPMLPLELFRIRAFSGIAMIAFAQSVALYPLLFFLAVYFQDALGLSPTGAGLRLLPITVLFFAAAPISGKLTSRVELRVPLTVALVLIGCSMLLMRGLTVSSEWTHLLPGFLLGGLGMGIISPALASAMVSVLPAERSGLASGINNTFRQLGIAMGLAALGAIFEHQVAGAADSDAGIVAGLNSVLLVCAVVALAAAALTWPLLGRHTAEEPAQT